MSSTSTSNASFSRAALDAYAKSLGGNPYVLPENLKAALGPDPASARRAVETVDELLDVKQSVQRAREAGARPLPDLSSRRSDAYRRPHKLSFPLPEPEPPRQPLNIFTEMASIRSAIIDTRANVFAVHDKMEVVLEALKEQKRTNDLVESLVEIIERLSGVTSTADDKDEEEDETELASSLDSDDEREPPALREVSPPALIGYEAPSSEAEDDVEEDEDEFADMPPLTDKPYFKAVDASAPPPAQEAVIEDEDGFADMPPLVSTTADYGIVSLPSSDEEAEEEDESSPPSETAAIASAEAVVDAATDVVEDKVEEDNDDLQTKIDHLTLEKLEVQLAIARRKLEAVLAREAESNSRLSRIG
ncbi:hypothetical protein JCM8547_006824 [Rhodosporidiobolus lusitaniae]